jgi:uncharacterized membrane protein YheB (UPF0754 family)
MNIDMLQILSEWKNGLDWGYVLEALKYIVIPFTSGFVGWFTNVVALKMTFYPIEFIGIKKLRLGWQGIIPSKATRMAEKAVDLMTTKLVKIEEQFARIEPLRVADEMAPALSRLSQEIIEETMEEEVPLLWETTPPLIKKRIFQKANEDLPEVVEKLMGDVKTNINELFDLKKMVIEELENDKPLLNFIFQKVGEEEFRFIERSGFYFGFLFGIIQAVVFALVYTPGSMEGAWVLPLFGLFIGWATNWLALKMIFEPQKPKKYGPWVLQGMFIKRQKEVAAEYSKIIAEKILTSKNIFENMIQGPASDRLISLIQKHVKKAVDDIAGLSKPIIQLAQGTRKYIHIKKHIANRFVEELPGSIRHMFSYAEEALAIEETLREKMAALSPVEFEAFLRPVFQEDETKLIAVGAVLGGLAGAAQLFILFI